MFSFGRCSGCGQLASDYWGRNQRIGDYVRSLCGGLKGVTIEAA